MIQWTSVVLVLAFAASSLAAEVRVFFTTVSAVSAGANITISEKKFCRKMWRKKWAILTQKTSAI
jgi:hypothetical protein